MVYVAIEYDAAAAIGFDGTGDRYPEEEDDEDEWWLDPEQDFSSELSLQSSVVTIDCNVWGCQVNICHVTQDNHDIQFHHSQINSWNAWND